MSTTRDIAIAATKKWLEKVVIGLNFCPFAAKPFKEGSIHYEVCSNVDLKTTLEKLMQNIHFLDEMDNLETLLIIFENNYLDFNKYLEMVELSERLLRDEGYEGVYQIASFHPGYLFAGSDTDDAANYTNRSPYPMLHLLREQSVENAIEKHIDIDAIPEKNINKARNLGIEYFKNLRF